jgi:hypothetical protein
MTREGELKQYAGTSGFSVVLITVSLHCEQVLSPRPIAKQYSDFWICHQCGELNPRVPNLNFREVAYRLEN